MEKEAQDIQEAFRALGVDGATRHAFLCLGPDCCDAAEGMKTWEYLKARLKQEKAPVLRTKAACLRVCFGGPWLVVYPEGIWYGRVTPERCERIVSEHLVGGKPVSEWQQHPPCTP